jgi:hypothetical protein
VFLYISLSLRDGDNHTCEVLTEVDLLLIVAILPALAVLGPAVKTISNPEMRVNSPSQFLKAP